MFAVPAVVTTVDIPICLPDAETRVVDTVARRMLGPRVQRLSYARSGYTLRVIL